MATGGLTTAIPAAGGDTNISLEEPWSTTTGNMYTARVWGYLRNLFQQDELTDVMLAAEGQSIPCHKVLLAAASTFFHDKFVVHPNESLEHNLLDIEGIDFDTLTAIVSFVYNGYVKLTTKITEMLIPASVSLMLPELTNLCKDFLIHKVKRDTSDCIDIHRIAKTNSLIDIADRAWQVMLTNFQEVSKVNAFREIPQTDLQNIISDERLNVANENPVFEAVVTWVRHDVDSRKHSSKILMENVKLSHCSLEFLGTIVRKEPLMETGNCSGYLFDAMYHHATSPQHSGTARDGYSKKSNTLIAVYCDKVYTLKDGESEWVTQTSSYRKRLEDSSGCVARDGIVFTGGNSYAYSSQCWKLTLPTMDWIALPDLNGARYAQTTVFGGNRVYVLGGDGRENISKSVDCFDEQNRAWHFSCDMPSTLYGHTAVSYKHFIYVFGGASSSSFYGEYFSFGTFVLDTVNKTWSRKADMPSNCLGGSSVVYRDIIYVLEGREKCCMSYDPDLDQWETHSKPTVAHDRPTAVVWKDRILLCGGVETSVIEEYNPDTDTWSQWKHQLPDAAPYAPAVFAIHM